MVVYAVEQALQDLEDLLGRAQPGRRWPSTSIGQDDIAEKFPLFFSIQIGYVRMSAPYLRFSFGPSRSVLQEPEV